MTIVEFIEARLREEETVAQECAAMDWSIKTSQRRIRGGTYEEVWLDGPGFNVAASVDPACMHPHDADHIARHDPARVLAQVAAMRRMLDLRYSWALQIDKAPDQVRHVFEAEVSAADAIIRGFAAIWSAHDDYDPAWSPDA